MPASSSLPTPDGSPLSEVDRRALTRFLEQSLDHGFRLAIVEAASHAEREDILADVASTIGPGLLRLNIDELPGAEANLWKALQQPFTTHSPRCLALWGLDSGTQADWAGQLNVQRDLFVRDFAVPWLLFIHPASRVPLLQAAPDFCDFAILWLRDDRQSYVPVASTDMHTQNSVLSVSGPDARDPLLREVQAALDAARFDAARDALSRFDLQPEHDVLDRVQRQLYGARLEREQGHPARAEALVRDAQNILERLPAVAEAQALTRLADAELGSVLQQSGRYDQAEALLRRTLPLAEEALGHDHPDYAALLNNLANALERQGNYTEAEPIIRDALSILAKAGEHETAAYGICLTGLANVLAAQGKYPEAERTIRSALHVKALALGPEHPSYGASLHDLAAVLAARSKYAEAERAIRDALYVKEKTLGREHPDYGRSLHTLASLLSKQGKHAEAEQILRESIPFFERTLGREHPDFSTSLHNLAITIGRQGKYAEAERILRDAVALKTKLLGCEHPDYGASLDALAITLMKQGKYPEAEHLMRKALSLHEKTQGNSHPRLYLTLASLATVVARQSRNLEGIRLLERALQIGEAALGADHPEVGHMRSQLKQLQRLRRRR